jgi:hypothetical protein
MLMSFHSLPQCWQKKEIPFPFIPIFPFSQSCEYIRQQDEWSIYQCSTMPLLSGCLLFSDLKTFLVNFTPAVLAISIKHTLQCTTELMSTRNKKKIAKYRREFKVAMVRNVIPKWRNEVSRDERLHNGFGWSLILTSVTE